MLGKRKARQEDLFLQSRSQISGKQALLRQINRHIDFSSFRKQAASFFSDTTGRPSIDPEVMVRMMFLGYLFGIRSDRELTDEVIDRDSFREFLGFGADEAIPDHSNFTRWRQRLGAPAFREFLRDLISQCEKSGMKLGSCRLYDSTRVKARAGVNTTARTELTPQESPDDYLEAFEWQTEEEKATEDPRYGKKIVTNTNDPEARLLRHTGEPSRFVHKVHIGVDSATGLVTDVMSTHKKEHLAMIEMLRREEHKVESIGADKGYSAVECFRDLEAMGIEAYIPVLDHANDKGEKYHLSDFTYDARTDTYTCPAKKKLTFAGIDRRKNCRLYTARPKECASCSLRSQCLRGKTRRALHISEDRPIIERMKEVNRLPKHARIMDRRKTVVEGTFAHAKNWLMMDRARAIGREAMEIQALLVGAVINVKKLLAHLESQTGSVALQSALDALCRLMQGLQALCEVTLWPKSGLKLSRC
ncbi:MAG: IS1182 family transposase [Methanotrichaceae archaeon]|nr:IS1182 family transposase [Methanotrichaceae archaeon]